MTEECGEIVFWTLRKKFVASGFEHCIANLFVIPFAIAIRHFAPRPFGNWRTVAQTIFLH